jgi:hypothetical protein
MNRRSLIRRLERLENRLGNNPKWRVRVEFYDISPDGTLIRLPHSDDEGTEAGQTIRVLYVDSDGNGPAGAVLSDVPEAPGECRKQPRLDAGSAFGSPRAPPAGLRRGGSNDCPERANANED